MRPWFPQESNFSPGVQMFCPTSSTETRFYPVESKLPLEATALPQRQPLCGYFASLQMHSPDIETFLQHNCLCPSLTALISLALSLETDR